MTYDDYIAFVMAYWVRHPEQRHGQVAVNVLRSLASHAYLADKIMYDYGIDPWDNQDVLVDWYKAVRENW